MFDKYQDAIIRAVNTFGDRNDPMAFPLFRTPPGGVAGMSTTCSVVSSLGLLPLLVVHVCASTIASPPKGQNWHTTSLSLSTFVIASSPLKTRERE